MRGGTTQSFFRRILSDIVEFRHITVPSSSRLPGSGDGLTTFSRIVTGPDRRMKRFSAHALSLLVLFACLAPAVAMAKSGHLSASSSRAAAAKVKVEAAVPPSLPDRNPNRAASSDSTPPQPVAAGPQTITVTPQTVQGDATTTGSVGLTTSNVAPTDALAASQTLTPPDRIRERGGGRNAVCPRPQSKLSRSRCGERGNAYCQSDLGSGGACVDRAPPRSQSQGWHSSARGGRGNLAPPTFAFAGTTSSASASKSVGTRSSGAGRSV